MATSYFNQQITARNLVPDPALPWLLRWLLAPRVMKAEGSEISFMHFFSFRPFCCFPGWLVFIFMSLFRLFVRSFVLPLLHAFVFFWLIGIKFVHLFVDINLIIFFAVVSNAPTGFCREDVIFDASRHDCVSEPEGLREFRENVRRKMPGIGVWTPVWRLAVIQTTECAIICGKMEGGDWIFLSLNRWPRIFHNSPSNAK